MADDTVKNRPEWDGKHDLYIGVKNDLSPFTVDLKALTRGLVVVGQSGCGKSFMLGRLVEEIVRKTEKSRLLIIDPNSDFCEGVERKEKDDFKKILSKYKSGLLKDEFKKFNRLELKLLRKPFAGDRKWPDAQIFGNAKTKIKYELAWIHFLENIGADSLLKAGKTTPLYFSVFRQFLGLLTSNNLEKDFENWFLGLNDIYDYLYKINNHELIYFSKQEVDKFLKNINEQEFIEFMTDIGIHHTINIWSKKEEKSNIPAGLDDSHINIMRTEGLRRPHGQVFLLLSLLNYYFYTHRNYINNFREHPQRYEFDQYYKINKKPHPKDPRLRTFILIDEAHNFAPEDTNDPHEKMLGELIHTIAAEGRKYGLHLILATQRPNKVKRGLLGELDNAIIMKMNSRRDLNDLAEEMRILDVKLLEPCLSFQGQGNAIAVGEMTRMAPYTQIFKSAPRRTKEGGVDIPFF